MQFTTIIALGLSAIAYAAPAAQPEAAALEARNGGSSYCCPKGGKSSCSPCGSSGKCPSGSDQYSNCSQDTQIGLVNVFLCDVLNDVTLDVPITVSL